MTAQPFVWSSKALQPGDLTGMHNAIVEASGGQVSSGGNLMISIRWRLALEDGSRGPAVFDNVTFTETAAWKVINLFGALGWSLEPLEGQKFDPKSADDRAFVDALAERLDGQRATLEIQMKPDNRGPDDDGNPRPDQPRVKNYHPYGAAKSVDNLFEDE